MSEWKRLASGAVLFQGHGFGFTAHEPAISERDRHQKVGHADGGRRISERPWINDGWWPPVTWPHIEREG